MGVTTKLPYLITIYTLLWIKSNEAPLVWISLDALGRSLVTKENTPFLYKLSQIASGSLEHHPNYITKTFPNHFSAATGLSVEDHQIVGNIMYDPKLGPFSYSNKDPAWWNPNGDTYPIWTLNEMHNKLGSATIYWPGSSTPFGNNILPKYHLPNFDSSCRCKCRLDKAYNLMKSGNYDLIMVYVGDVDGAGHRLGTKQLGFIQTLKRVDALVENFFNQIRQDSSLSTWNMMISSDHGMENLYQANTLVLDTIIPNTIKYTLLIKNSQGQLNLVVKSNINTVIQMISGHAGVDTVATRKSMPSEYKYSKSTRIPDITIIMKEGWAVVKNQYEKKKLIAGDHGYPSKIAPSMIAIMMGYGKDFKPNIKIPKTKMTDLFGVACYILEIEKYCKIDPHGKNIATRLVSISQPKTDSPYSTVQPTSTASSAVQPTSPASSVLQPTSPASSVLKPTSPASSVLQPTSPASSVSQPTSPASSVLQPTSPASSVLKPTSPASSVSKPTSSASSVSQPTSPASSVLQPTSSASSVLKSTSPASSVLQPTSPASSVLKPTSPASSVLQPTSPASSVLKPTSPASSVLQPTSSASSVLKSTSPASSVLQPTSPASSAVQSTSSASSVLKPTSPASSTVQQTSSGSSVIRPPSTAVQSTSSSKVVKQTSKIQPTSSVPLSSEKRISTGSQPYKKLTKVHWILISVGCALLVSLCALLVYLCCCRQAN